MSQYGYTKKQGAKQPVRSYDGKVIGEIRGDTLIKRVTASRHKMRTPPGWAVDAYAIMNARAQGVKRIEIRDRESGRVWRCSMDQFTARAIEKDYPGYGKQLLLPDTYWTEITPGRLAGEQLNMF